MKKDYIPKVIETDNEIELIEDHWTKKWENWNVSNDINKICNREETKLMMKYLDTFPKGSKILDGGCGMGLWTIMLNRKGHKVYGLDISKQTIERLQVYFADQHFQVGDIRETGFENGYFDAYFSWGTFEHFENGMGDCFKEAHRILNEEGMLFLTIPFQNKRHLKRDAGSLENWDEHYSAKEGYNKEMHFYQWRLTIPEMKREVEMNGFKAVEIIPIHHNQGIIRHLASKGIKENDKMFPILKKLYSKITTADTFGHMLFVAARKIK